MGWKVDTGWWRLASVRRKSRILHAGGKRGTALERSTCPRRWCAHDDSGQPCGANTAIRDVGDLSRFRSEKDVSQAVKAHDELVIPCGKDLAFEVEQWGASGAPTAQKPDLYPYNLDLVFWEP
ncbi:hypothetical protein N7468_002494 [Penicillium chermesinum]|uniref:Uncharacterized protein n=1 Tax=Penicillium chermesinum TaxID=63820 RepID=A0A9W9PKA3_9EURO|nr:uncharacterized protein N7468_002494 [Penicillium chermesinum]KAJ5247511.1 hypothetical protein N7468_002494 [Penicillium chermesinum]